MASQSVSHFVEEPDGTELDPERIEFEEARRQSEGRGEQFSASVAARELVLALLALVVWFGLLNRVNSFLQSNTSGGG